MKCNICGKDREKSELTSIRVCRDGSFGGSQKSVPAGGCVASGEVTEPVAVDGRQVGTGLTLKKVGSFDGVGWYYSDKEDEWEWVNGSFAQFIEIGKEGVWWKMCRVEK